MTRDRHEAPAEGPEHDDELPSALRDALDSMTTPDPRPEFRAKLRGAFVAGDLRCSDTAVEAALGQWDVPAATDEFRDRCRANFLRATGAPGAPVATATPNRPGAGRLLRFLPLAAAALVAALLIPELMRAELRWVKLEGGPVTVDGISVANPTAEELDRLMRRHGSCQVEQDSGKVLWRYDRGLLVEMDSGTEFGVLPNTDEGTGLALEVTSGSVRISAKEGYRKSVSISTPDADVVMRGEAVGVNVVPEKGTCVCCMQGEAEVDPVVEGVESYRLESGDSTWLEHGSREVKVMRDEVHHREPLEDLRESARTYFY